MMTSVARWSCVVINASGAGLTCVVVAGSLGGLWLGAGEVNAMGDDCVHGVLGWLWLLRSRRAENSKNMKTLL